MASKTLSNDQHRLLRRVKKVAYLIGLFLAMTIICLPGLWIVLSSLRPPVEIMAKPPVWIPQEITLDAYYAMFSGAGGGGIPVWDYFRNSLIISVTSTIIALIVGVSGGYAFARFRFWGKSTTFLGLMLTRSVPGIALSLPLFMLYSHALAGLLAGGVSACWSRHCHRRHLRLPHFMERICAGFPADPLGQFQDSSCRSSRLHR